MGEFRLWRRSVCHFLDDVGDIFRVLRMGVARQNQHLRPGRAALAGSAGTVAPSSIFRPWLAARTMARSPALRCLVTPRRSSVVPAIYSLQINGFQTVIGLILTSRGWGVRGYFWNRIPRHPEAMYAQMTAPFETSRLPTAPTRATVPGVKRQVL